MSSYHSIAIDGPAGAGKSTIAKKIANKLKYIYIDTGAMYRAFALYCIRQNTKQDDEFKINDLCSKVEISIKYVNGEQQVILNGENVNGLIRTAKVGQMASAISVYKSVRLKLVELQRTLSNNANIIMDGRDIGTYVLPNANLKIYLTASVKERARRRWLELNKQGEQSDITYIEKEIKERDNRDMNRSFAPLKKATDSIEIDSSDMTIDEVVNKIIKLYNNLKDENR
ncbi:MAG: (d)CMP kinase [Eubacteriales bacterium]